MGTRHPPACRSRRAGRRQTGGLPQGLVEPGEGRRGAAAGDLARLRGHPAARQQPQPRVTNVRWYSVHDLPCALKHTRYLSRYCFVAMLLQVAE